MKLLGIPKGFWYVATPYSKYADGLDAAFDAACDCTGRLLAAGVPVYSPIVHSHPISRRTGLDPLAHEFWLHADQPLMEAAHGLLVLMLPGWAESVGVAHERAWFTQAGKPVHFLDPNDL